MNRYKYSWSKKFAVDAQVAGEIFQRLKSDAAVYEHAKNPKSPLHSVFDWDDASAAQSHRLHQIAVMRCSLVVEVVNSAKKPQMLRAFINRVDRSQGFVPTLEATTDELTAAEKKLWLDMKRKRDEWKNFQLAREVVDAIDAVDRSLSRVRGKRVRHA